MRLKPIAIGLWIAVFVLGGILVADRMVAPPSPGPVQAEPPAPAPAPAQATGGEPVARLVPFTLPDLAGTPRSSSEWAGRTVLFNFWATWCAPCRKEMPLLQQLHESVAGPPGAPMANPPLAVVGIAIDRLEPVQRFIGEIGVSYPILVGQMDATRVGESFGVELVGLPYSAVVGPDGAVLAILLGELRAEDLALIADVARMMAAGELDSSSAKKRLASLPRAKVRADDAA
jgi:thiol-disulfide isomerase/thioredoxin